MAKGDTKTNQYLDIAANGTRADLPTDTCCETRSQTLIREVAERIMDVEDEVEEIKNNPDVVDIVPTYAALQDYDTSGLTDKDIIRVLADETHDGASTYYRYSTATGTFTYIGESKQYEDFVGTDGTAGGQNGLVPAPVATDAGKFLNANGSWEEVQAGGVTELTTADYNWPTNNPTSVALWLLEPGVYTWNNGVNVQLNTDNRAKKGISIVSSPENDKVSILNIPAKDEVMWFSTVTQSNGQQTRQFSIEGAVDYLTDTSGTAPLAANQGRVLKSQIGNLANLTTTDKTNLVAAINEAAGGGGGPTVVQTTGTSTTDVMSQNAVTSMIFADPATQYKIKIGAGTSTSEGQEGIEIGHNASARGTQATAIGYRADALGENSVALGHAAQAYANEVVSIGSGTTSATNAYFATALGAGASVYHRGSVALGSYSTTTGIGQVNIGPTLTNAGYNNTNYRLLTGLYDPQNAHDAATKGYVDPTTDSSAPTTATVGRLGQIQIDTTTATAYMCVAADTATPSYTWKQITA